MTFTLQRIQELAEKGDIRVSSHGYDELAEDGILVHDIMASLADARVIEDYPNFGKGPCTLALQRDADGEPVHVVWGIPRGHTRPGVLVTAYRPDPAKWAEDFLTRRQK